MPTIKENGVFISLPGALIKPPASSSWSRPRPVMSSATQPCSPSKPFQA